VVPLVSAIKKCHFQILPFHNGAISEPRITAAIAAIYKNRSRPSALSIGAFSILSCFGALIFMPSHWSRNILSKLAIWMGKKSVESRFVAFCLHPVTFFIIPFFTDLFQQRLSSLWPLQFFELQGKLKRANPISFSALIKAAFLLNLADPSRAQPQH